MPKTITDYIDLFNQSNKESGTRYATFDLCYGYFNSNRKKLIGDNMEKSCYVLWSYLASWGMLRGSSFLLQMNPSYLIPLVKYINGKGDIMFDVDIDSYTQNSNAILSSYNEIEIILTPDAEPHTTPSKTLITKIMLGVFGCIPAYDRYFIGTFKSEGIGFCSPKLSPKSIECISDFYTTNTKEISDLINNYNNVKDFYGKGTELKYPIAKIIDMYGFQKGLIDERIKKKKETGK